MDIQLSKFLALILRHNPSVIKIVLSNDGWADVDELLSGINNHSNFTIDFSQLEAIVTADDKQRYSFDSSLQRIRANQGHSLQLDLVFSEVLPPDVLYHGTNQRAVQGIRKDGLLKMKRHHVHLSTDLETAERVGSRRGLPVIFNIDARQMSNDGFKFFYSENGVFLTDHVPTKYLS